MKLVFTEQVDFPCVLEDRTDLWIAASGYESRSFFASERLVNGLVDARIAFSFRDRKTEQRLKNDALFEASQFKLVEGDGNSDEEIRRILREFLGTKIGKCVHIVVDYSCMTKCWYAGIVRLLQEMDQQLSVTVDFIYTPAKYTPPCHSTSISEMKPIDGFYGLCAPDTPTALILGLGYDRGRASGLIEYIDPAVVYAFVCDPALDEKYELAVKRNNSDLLRSVSKDQIISHSLVDLNRTTSLLRALCDALHNDYRLVAAPLGVKPFALSCLLLSTVIGDLDVWRVTSGEKAEPLDRKPIDHIIVLRAHFSWASDFEG